MPTDDYIKRSDVLQIECDLCAATHCKRDYKCIKAIRINNLPAADVEPVRHGRWVKMTGMMPPEFTGHYSCSECDWFCKKHSIRETEFDFCPGCGAKMMGEEDGGESTK